MDESVETGPSVHDNPLDIEQIRLEAQNQWLSRSQICEILRNYEKFGITSKPPNKPPSGSLFLFDKKVQKHFRRDGHNWKKGSEGHRKFQDGSLGGLNCYYGHVEENRNFQRRCYWMLRGDFSHIVFVHYLEVTGKTEDSSCVKETQGAAPYSQETKDIMPNSEIDGSMHSSSHLNNCQVTENTDTWQNCAQALEHESAQSVDIEYNHQPSSGLHPDLELRRPAAENIDAGVSDPYDPLFSPTFPCIDLSPTQLDKGKSDNDAELAHDPRTNNDSASWKYFLDTYNESIQYQSLFSSSCPDIMGKFFSNSAVKRLDSGDSQIRTESKPMDQKLNSDSACDTTRKFHEEEVNHLESMNSIDPQLKGSDIRKDYSMENCFQTLLSNEEHDYALPPDLDGCFNLEGKSIYSSDIEHLIDGILAEEGSKKRSSSGANGTTDLDPTQLDMGNSDTDAELAQLTHDLWSSLDLTLLEDDLESFTPCSEPIEYGSLSSSSCPDTVGTFVSNNVVKRLDFGGHLQIQEKSKASFEDSSSFFKWPMDQKLYSESAYDTTSKSMKYREHDHVPPPDSDDYLNLKGKSVYSSAIKQSLFDCSLMEGGLEELDSLNRLMTKELGDVTDVDESHMLSGSWALWGTVENENGIEIGVSSIPSEGQVHTFKPGPSVSQDQLFSIIDFSPKWAYIGSETEVLIVGRFMKSPHVLENCKWSCMFGEVEVPAEVIADGVLRCHIPTHEASRVPFYITSSSRLVCSEVREFEYRTIQIEDISTAENYSGSADDNLQLRFDKLLSLSSKLTISDTSSLGDISQLSSKINTLRKDISEWEQMLKLTSGEEFSSEKLNEKLFQKLLKEKLHVRLLQKVAECGKGPSVLDEGGQGVLRFAAALGYGWALEPTISAGVSVDFRDVNGWTARHWAASCRREHAVASLISLGAAPGALTYPSPKYPSGRTPADLASVNGHKGIAGHLADCSLDVHMSSINLDHPDDAAGPKVVQRISEISAAPLGLGNASPRDLLATISFRTLTLVCMKSQKKFVHLGPVTWTFEVVKRVYGLEGLECLRSLEIRHKRQAKERSKEEEQEEKEEDEGLENDDGPEMDEGPEKDNGPEKDEGPEKDNGPEKDEGPENKKEEGKKRAPDPALESGKAYKILKAYSAFMALLTAYYNVQSMETIQMLVLVFVEASKKTGERKLSYIDDGFELSAIPVEGRKHRRN